MKRISKIVGYIAVLCMLMCMFAYAETATLYPDENGAYDVTYQGTANEYYVVLVVSGTYTEDQTPVISEQTILYIDQVTAAGDGTTTFENFVPKTATDGTVYIGGSNLESAVLYGYIASELPTTTVSGTVNAVSGRQATVTLTDVSDSTKIYSVQTTSTTFEISVNPSTYRMVITAPGHLSYTKNLLDATTNVNTIDVTLKGGDTKPDEKVDFYDLSVILNNYGATTSNGDVDGNGSIGFADLQSVLNNYGHTATVVD